MTTSASSTPINHAAILSHARAYPLHIETVAYPTVGVDELVIHIGAVAINPVDSYLQQLGDDTFPNVKYPVAIGMDVAGTVAEVGPGTVASNFAVGDRVMGVTTSYEPREGAFQEFAVIHASLVTRIPPTLPFTDAAVLPLGVATASSALYEPDHLALALPTNDADPNSRGQVVLVWAGASSVGVNAIQLAAASGYEVFTTSSPRNFDLCRSLGASQIFDYKSSTVIADIIEALQGKTLAGVVSIIAPVQTTVYDIVASSKVQGVKKVAVVISTYEVPPPPTDVSVSKVHVASIKNNRVIASVFRDYLETALAQGSYQARPSALIVGKGLAAIQGALDKEKEGKPPAKKLVIDLE